MKKTIAGLIAGLTVPALLALPLPGLAAQSGTQGQSGYRQSSGYSRLSYTYGEARLVIEEPDGGDSFDGIRLGGSLQFQPQVFGVASLTSVSSDGVDIDTFDLGVGFRHALQSNVDLVGIVGLVWAEVDAGPFEDDDTGISLTGGVRGFAAPQLELGGYASYAEVFGDGDITLTGEGLLHLSPNLALVASLGFSDDVNILTFGARWNFVPTRQ